MTIETQIITVKDVHLFSPNRQYDDKKWPYLKSDITFLSLITKLCKPFERKLAAYLLFVVYQRTPTLTALHSKPTVKIGVIMIAVVRLIEVVVDANIDIIRSIIERAVVIHCASRRYCCFG